MQFVTVNKISPKWHTLNIENCIRLGASVTGSIIKSTHGKLSIWESIRYTHIRSYQKSAIKLVTIKHFSRNARATKKGCFYYLYNANKNKRIMDSGRFKKALGNYFIQREALLDNLF